jgi:hypothetical protein
MMSPESEYPETGADGIELHHAEKTVVDDNVIVNRRWERDRS